MFVLQANWFKAQQYCRFHGMHLASISSQQENDKLEQYVKDSGKNYFTLYLWLASPGSRPIPWDFRVKSKSILHEFAPQVLKVSLKSAQLYLLIITYTSITYQF